MGRHKVYGIQVLPSRHEREITLVEVSPILEREHASSAFVRLVFDVAPRSMAGFARPSS
jgi:hypothetical protein